MCGISGHLRRVSRSWQVLAAGAAVLLEGHAVAVAVAIAVGTVAELDSGLVWDAHIVVRGRQATPPGLLSHVDLEWVLGIAAVAAEGVRESRALRESVEEGSGSRRENRAEVFGFVALRP